MPSTVTAAVVILAHQGGWDEILMVAGPVLLMWLVLRAANRRAHRMVDRAEGFGTGEGTTVETATEYEVRSPDRPSPRER